MKGLMEGVTNKWVMLGLVVLLVLLVVCFMRKNADSKESVAKGIVNKLIMPSLGVWLMALLVMFVSVILFDSAAVCVKQLFEAERKIEAIELLGWAINGTFIAIGLAVLSQRVDAQIRAAKAQEDIAKVQADVAKVQGDIAKVQADATQAQVENNRLAEKGHTQERLKTATEHLGHINASVRIAAFYEFIHLIRDNGEEYRKSILDILYAHTRATTTDFENSAYVKDAKKKNEKIKTTEEIQGLLDVLFKTQDIDHSGIEPNLQRVYFSGANLFNADLSGADLSRANLSNTFLYRVNLSNTFLFETNLSEAFLREADLSKAILSGADLSRANLSKARLGRAFYTDETRFPEWLVLPIVPPDNGDTVRFPEDFVAPEKPEDDG